MRRLSFMLVIVLCLITIGCNKGVSPTEESVPTVADAPTMESTSSPTEPPEPVKALTEAEVWQILSEELTVRDGGYKYICKSTEEKTLDGIECYLMHVRTCGQKAFYNSNGDEVSSEFTYGWFAVDKYSEAVYELTLDMEHLKELGNDLPFDPTQTEDYAYLCEHSEVAAYKWVKAILDKDPAVCTDLAFSYPEGEQRHEEWYNWLYQIKLGGYSVKIDHGDDPDSFYDDELAFVFEVVESAYDIFPEGEYAYRVSSGGLFYIWWTPVEKKELNLDYDISRAMRVLPLYTWSLDPSWLDGRGAGGIFSVAYSLKGEERGISAEDLKDAVYNVFGIENFASGGGVAIEQDGYFVIMGGGGLNMMHNLVEVKHNGAFTEVYVQMYGDLMKTVRSYYVKYVFEKTDGEYPYRVISIETLDEGITDPYGWYS